MNIVGIGTDIVSIARIRSIWERYGYAFARRILAKSELEYLHNKDVIAFLAKRYAAKEAAAKALGTGFRPQGVLLTDISVSNNSLGQPFLNFTGGASLEMQRRAVKISHLSISDEQEYALAFVVLVG